MTDNFILSQYNYYKKHLLSGTSQDQLLINGCFLRYETEARKRGLL